MLPFPPSQNQPNLPSQPCALLIATFDFFWCVFSTTRQSMMTNCSPRPFAHIAPKCQAENSAATVHAASHSSRKQQFSLVNGLAGVKMRNTARLGIHQQTPAPHTPRCVISSTSNSRVIRCRSPQQTRIKNSMHSVPGSSQSSSPFSPGRRRSMPQASSSPGSPRLLNPPNTNMASRPQTARKS